MEHEVQKWLHFMVLGLIPAALHKDKNKKIL